MHDAPTQVFAALQISLTGMQSEPSTQPMHAPLPSQTLPPIEAQVACAALCIVSHIIVASQIA